MNRHNPVYSGVNRGEGENEVSVPFTVSQQTDTIAMCMCVTVGLVEFRCLPFFNEGIHQRTIRPWLDCLFLMR